MAQIYNSDLFKELKDGAKIQQSRDVVPSQLADKVVPVMEVNPKLLRRSMLSGGSSRTTTGTATYLTTPADRDFYVTAISLGVCKDAACDVATGQIRITAAVNGASSSILAIPVLTLTAQNIVITQAFDAPLKLDRSTALQTSATYAAGLMAVTVTYQGYFVENSNA